ncbi:MAG: alpha/beta hydrolase [Vicinamibacterales bacterium]|jgi:pimeloyl-ACP methyl ester carboxylesterase|nr:alpha/beta hydrolase [Vicinamibacterales bacterium]
MGIIIALLVSLLSVTPPRQVPAAGTVPRYERAACPVEVAPGERIDCGVLVVPEHRGVAGTLAIRLPVVIFRSRSASPTPDPVLYMAGGPGNSTVDGRRSGKELPFLDDRDYILLEQRGARHAQPSLACPETNVLTAEISAGRLRGAAATSELAKAAGACRQRLTSAGVDLDGYTSAAAADDVEDLRKALGYDTWNLQGISYSTRLMLTVLRRHPAGVRSVILDSVLPPEVDFDEVSAANLQRALNAVFDACGVDRGCSKAYPGVRRAFVDLVAAADARPLALGVLDEQGRAVEVRGSQVVDAIYAALHDVQAIPRVPSIVADAAAGRYQALAALVKGNQGPSSFTWGLRYSVWCAEEMPFEDPARIAAQTSPDLGLGGINEGAASPEECRAWRVAPAAAEENTPVASDVPVLVFAGEFDPDTPPSWGRGLLETMPNARYVELLGRSHGAGFSACGGEIAQAFLRDPRGPLPVDCALRLRGAAFGNR